MAEEADVELTVVSGDEDVSKEVEDIEAGDADDDVKEEELPPPPVDDAEESDSLLSRPPRPSPEPCMSRMEVGGLLSMAGLVGLLIFLFFGNPDAFKKPPLAEGAEAEARFSMVPSATMAREHLSDLTLEPHVAGSVGDYKTVQIVQSRWNSYGLNTSVAEYEVLLTRPLQRSLALLEEDGSGVAFQASLAEKAVPQDGTSRFFNAVPTFNGYSANGNVTARVVYVNYCRVQDFDTAAAAGVDFAGRIILCRYGAIFRGNKVDNADARGAVGVIIYLDPADHSDFPAFPAGPQANGDTVQRGSVFNGEGDPLTPGWASLPGAPRLTLDEARGEASIKAAGWKLGRIPALPISWNDAAPFLAACRGPAVGLDAQGGLNFTYHYGPSDAQVHMLSENSFNQSSIWNVISVIRGREEPDRAVIAGNHRDAWVMGAVDPSSGTASLLELGRGLGDLLSRGWRPRRTIILASWDAEEYGLVGSTEWAEQHAALLSKSVVAYLNVDESFTGPGALFAAATPNMRDAIYTAASRAMQPKADGVGLSKQSVLEFWQEDSKKTKPEVTALGSGSDQTAFISHLGISAVDMGFAPKQTMYGVYHSVYDSFYWMSQVDPNAFEYLAAAARVWGELLLQFSDEKVLPHVYHPYADALTNGLRSLQVYATQAQFGSDSLSWSTLETAVTHFRSAAMSADSMAKTMRNEVKPNELKLRVLNDRLMQTERAFIMPNGLPGRPWFRHAIFSPALHNSYGGELFPSIQDAMVSGDLKDAQAQIALVAAVVDGAADVLAGSLPNEFDF